MIDCTTGALRLADARTPISPALSRVVFLSSPLAKEAAVWVRNEPYCSFKLQVAVGAARFVMILHFYGGALQSVDLMLDEERFGGASWADWSEAKEQERKHAHDAWLREQLGAPPYRYAWGTVESSYDQRSGGSGIMLQYTQARTKWRRWRFWR